MHTFSNGVRIYDDHIIPAQRERYARNNVHEMEEEAIFLKLVTDMPVGSVYVDVGAAVGYYCILAKKYRPEIRVVAVEALARHRAYMAENFRLNGFEARDFTVIPEAISSVSGHLDFVDMNYSSFVNTSGKVRENASVEKVRAITLSELVGSQEAPIGLLQMDIQGEEVGVLAEFSRAMPDGGGIAQFLVGTHSRDIHVRCRKMLAGMGYRIIMDDPKPAHQPDGILAAVKH
ncbi:MAG: FkbM family methyltransferase [Thiobacillus sp.]|nr:FkbM family methyltransferase [Thiobacillus sp.]